MIPAGGGEAILEWVLRSARNRFVPDLSEPTITTGGKRLSLMVVAASGYWVGSGHRLSILLSRRVGNKWTFDQTLECVHRFTWKTTASSITSTNSAVSPRTTGDVICYQQ